MVVLSGCTLDFQTIKHVSSPVMEESTSALPTMKVAPESIKLEIVFVDRYVSDPLWTPDLWKGMDRISNLSVEQRAMIDENGLYVGVCGSIPPPALQRLLEMQSEIPDLATSSREKNVRGQSSYRLSGQSTLIETGPMIPQLDVASLFGRADSRPVSLKSIEEIHEAHTMLDVRVDRLQDGWVKLFVTPEIHHGQERLRPVPDQQGFSLATSRVVESLAELRFDLTLNVGEMMVVTVDPDVEDQPGLGRRFFEFDGDSGRVRRLVLIRISDMKKIKPLYQ